MKIFSSTMQYFSFSISRSPVVAGVPSHFNDPLRKVRTKDWKVPTALDSLKKQSAAPKYLRSDFNE